VQYANRVDHLRKQAERNNVIHRGICKWQRVRITGAKRNIRRHIAALNAP
jgi:hypothetical protein